MEDERLKVEKEKREERERERQERRVERAARDRSVLIIVYSSEWSQCVLKSVNKLRYVTWTRSEGDRQDGKKIEVFIFLFFFVNRFVDCFFLYSFYHHHY